MKARLRWLRPPVHRHGRRRRALVAVLADTPSARYRQSALFFALLIATVCAVSGLATRLADATPIDAPPFNSPPAAHLWVRPASGDSLWITVPSDPLPVVPMTDAARPLYLTPSVDPVYGTLVTRVTNDSGRVVPLSGGAASWGADARHHYSKDQPWNSDGTLIAIQNKMSPRTIFLDGETYEPKFGECDNYSRDDDRWHPSPAHPHERINVKNAELMWWDVVNCVKTRSWTLPFAPQHIGDGEGNPSRDGRYLALCDSSRMFVVDMDPQPPYAPYPNVRIGPVYDFGDCGLAECRLGWVAVSPSAKYVVCKYGGDHPRVFDLDPATLAMTQRPMPPSAPRCTGDPAKGFVYDLGHCDMAMNPFDNNEDVLIGQEHCDWAGTVVGGKLIGNVVMARLRDGAITPLTDPTNEAYPHHISTRNELDPRWAFVGYYPYNDDRFGDEIVAIKLDGSKAVRRLVQKHSDTSGDCYRCEAHAVPSPDGRRVMWASNWALHCTDCGALSEIKAYVADARLGVETISGTSPFATILDASRTRDPNGTVLSYRFDFGDGSTQGWQPSPVARHSYGVGDWTAIVTAMDEDGATDTATVHVHVIRSGPDQAPIVSAVPIATGHPTLPMSIDVTAQDPDGEAITSLTADLSTLPPGHGATFTVNAAHTAGTLVWTPTVADSGHAHVVTFRASNALTGSAATTVMVGVGPNLVTNPSFETSTSGWNAYTGSTLARIPNGLDGTWSLQATGPATTASFGINDSPNWITNVPSAGARYRLSAWVRSASHTGTARLRVREYLGGIQQGPTVYAPNAILSPNWQKLEFEYTTLAAGSAFDIQIIDVPTVASEVFEIDLVSIYDVSRGVITAVDGHGVPDLAVVVAPNPFVGRGTLSFSLPARGFAHVTLFDVNGRRLRRLMDATDLAAGRYTVPVTRRDAGQDDLQEGIYFYRVSIAVGSVTGKFVILE